MHTVFHSASRRVALVCTLMASTYLLAGCGESSPSASEHESRSASHSTVAQDLSGNIGYGRIPSGGYKEEGGLFTANASRIGEQPLVLPEGSCCPRLSRDGTRMLFFTGDGPDSATGTAATMRVDGSDYRVVPVKDPTLNYIPQVWSQDSERIAFEGWDASHPDRNGIYTARAADGKDIRRLTAITRNHDIPMDYSPDGRHIVFYRTIVPDPGPWDQGGSLWIVNVDGTHAHRIKTPGVMPSWSARWSPDGSKILFSTARAQTTGSLWTVDAHGSHLTKLFEDTEGRFPFFPEWSPDGSRTMFSLNSLADYHSHPISRICVINADGTELAEVIRDDDYKAMFGWWR